MGLREHGRGWGPGKEAGAQQVWFLDKRPSPASDQGSKGSRWVSAGRSCSEENQEGRLVSPPPTRGSALPIVLSALLPPDSERLPAAPLGSWGPRNGATRTRQVAARDVSADGMALSRGQLRGQKPELLGGRQRWCHVDDGPGTWCDHRPLTTPQNTPAPTPTLGRTPHSVLARAPAPAAVSPGPFA